MKDAKAFFDTNVLIYAFTKGDPRAAAAERLLAGGGVVGVQTLNEFVAVAMRKLGFAWKELMDALDSIQVLCPAPAPLTMKTHERALRVARRYGYHIYDSLIIAAALEASCEILYSEDMRAGQVIGGLTIRNPFRSL